MRTVAILALLATHSASAQNNWADAGMPYQSAGIRQLYTDSAQDRLIACGLLTVTNNFGAVPLAVYSNGSWDTLGSFDDAVYTAIRYGDTLLVGGGFHLVDSIGADLVAAWYGGAWHPFGVFPTDYGVVRKLQIMDGSLYAVGSFLTVDGDTCHGVAKRVGGQWENLGTIQYYTGAEPIILAICEYQGNIVVGGEINPVGLGSDLIQFDGNSWSAVGGGILGGIGSVAALVVYHNDLYVGGGISVQDGNAGHGLIRWDGYAWHDVGGSMRDIYGTTNNNASAGSFLVHDDKLLVGGAFGYAGTLHANQFAIWDGQSWCDTGDSIGGNVESMAFYHDTLFIACTNSLDGQPANYIARWVGGAFEQDCETVDIEDEFRTADVPFAVGALDGDGRNLFGLPDGRVQLQVFDATGRLVTTGTVVSMAGHARMHFPEPASGVYVMRALAEGYRATARFVSER